MAEYQRMAPMEIGGLDNLQQAFSKDLPAYQAWKDENGPVHPIIEQMIRHIAAGRLHPTEAAHVARHVMNGENTPPPSVQEANPEP